MRPQGLACTRGGDCVLLAERQDCSLRLINCITSKSAHNIYIVTFHYSLRNFVTSSLTYNNKDTATS